MGDNLFEGLPAPSHQQEQEKEEEVGRKGKDQSFLSLKTSSKDNNKEASPNPVLKSALKRPKPTEGKPHNLYDSYFFFSFLWFNVCFHF